VRVASDSRRHPREWKRAAARRAPSCGADEALAVLRTGTGPVEICDLGHEPELAAELLLRVRRHGGCPEAALARPVAFRWLGAWRDEYIGDVHALRSALACTE
jgi:hypothetical protein